jgi:hypothetical protein
MPAVDVISEQECPRGWLYTVRLQGVAGPATEHEVRLDWAEHELWCGGRCPPSRVVEVLLNYLMERDAGPADREGGREIPGRFDAATVRRWWPEVDQVLPQRL